MLNRKLLFAGYLQRNQSLNLSDQAVGCVLVYQRGTDKKKLTRKKGLADWILQHPYVVQFPISNACIKVSNYGHSETQLFTNILLQVTV